MKQYRGTSASSRAVSRQAAPARHPDWNEKEHTLRWRGETIVFRPDAEQVHCVLRELQKAGWEPVPNPLPRPRNEEEHTGPSRKAALHKIADRLDRRLRSKGLHFRVKDGHVRVEITHMKQPG